MRKEKFDERKRNEHEKKLNKLGIKTTKVCI